MEFSTSSFAATLVLLVGGLICWANPRRNVNRSVFAVSLTVATWLACSHWATTSVRYGLVWLKLTYLAGGLVPLALWLVKESILSSHRPLDRTWLLRNLHWFVGAGALALAPFTDAFIPPESTDAARLRGWAYYGYYAGLLLSYCGILYGALRNMKTLSGARRLELQVWLCGGCVVVATIYLMIALGTVTQDPVFRHLQTLAVLFFYAGTGYAITTHRIFDARQILLVVGEKSALVLMVAIAAYALDRMLKHYLSDAVALIATTGLTLWIAFSLNEWLDRIFRFSLQGLPLRQAAFAAAQRGARMDDLEYAFTRLIKGWGQTDRVLIVAGVQGSLIGGGVEIPSDGVLVRAMRQLRWVTPERLARERPSTDRLAVGDFLSAQGLGALVLEEGSALTVLVGVGVGAARRPYTYPQITQLAELASIMQAAWERAHFSVKVQHAEQLATVGLLGASLAHEIRNPLVTIKTFVQLLPTHHQDAAFRAKFFKLIGDEVNRIDRLTEQLLDLASPRTYAAEMIALHPVLRTSLDLVAAKATDKHIEFQTDFQASPDTAWSDASAAKQVLLNLCFNAIQSLEAREGERWVRIATRNTPGGIEMAVSDSGPGIAEEIRPRLFQPFQSTKSTGFGLGLAICSDILANLDATITVDPTVPGRGATFRVIFPCQPLSS